MVVGRPRSRCLISISLFSFYADCNDNITSILGRSLRGEGIGYGRQPPSPHHTHTQTHTHTHTPALPLATGRPTLVHYWLDRAAPACHQRGTSAICVTTVRLLLLLRRPLAMQSLAAQVETLVTTTADLGTREAVARSSRWRRPDHLVTAGATSARRGRLSAPLAPALGRDAHARPVVMNGIYSCHLLGVIETEPIRRAHHQSSRRRTTCAPATAGPTTLSGRKLATKQPTETTKRGD